MKEEELNNNNINSQLDRIKTYESQIESKSIDENIKTKRENDIILNINRNNNIFDYSKKKINSNIEEKSNYSIMSLSKYESENNSISNESIESLMLNGKQNFKLKDDFTKLISLGFEKKMILKIYNFLNPIDIIEAMKMMSKINGIYQHNFFLRKNNKSNDKCFICNEKREFHINENREKIENSNKLNNNKLTLLDLEKDINNENNICLICYEEIKNEDLEKIKINCGHLFCFDCWIEYIEEKLKSFDNIICMEKTCKKEISNEKIKELIINNEKLLNNFEKYLINKEILKNPNKKFCPYPDCNGIGIMENLENEKEKYIKCTNGHKFCFFCLKNWHGKKLCKEEVEKDFKNWKKNKNTQQCPNCKIWIEKNDGCNHITCSNCKYEFCWICLGKYDDNHFKIGGCTQYIDWKICHNIFFRALYKFFFSIIIYLFICLFAFPYFVSSILIEHNNGIFSILSFLCISIIYEIQFFCITFIILIIFIVYQRPLDNYFDFIEFLAKKIINLLNLDY